MQDPVKKIHTIKLREKNISQKEEFLSISCGWRKISLICLSKAEKNSARKNVS